MWQQEAHGAVAVLTFSRPPDNYMNFAGLIELGDLLEACAAKPDEIKIVALASGIPDVFINHADLADLEKIGAGEATPEEQGSWRRALGLLEDIPQPVIAAIDGLASGGGHELALACTLRAGSPRTRLEQPEVPGGIIPAGGGSVRLPRLVGPGLAADVILTGRQVRAEEAHAVNWLNRVFRGDDFRDEVLAWATLIAAAPAPSLRAAKTSIVRGSRLPFADALTQERTLFGQLRVG